MGRPAKFTDDELLDAASSLIATAGPSGLSVKAVAQAVGAPSGSIYHRFASRDHLAGALWLRAAERFQRQWADATQQDELDDADIVEVVCASAAFTLSWARDHRDDARVLLLYRSGDLMGSGWPADLVARNADQQQLVTDTVAALHARLGGSSPDAQRRLRFAMFDLPIGAIRSALARDEAIADELDAIVDDAVRAVLAPLI